MKFNLRFLALVAALALAPSLADAQSVTKLCIPGTFPSCQDVTTSNPLPTKPAVPAAYATGVTGTSSGVANTASTQVIALVTAKSIYVTAFSCANTGATASLITFQDGSAGATIWQTINPAGGGSNLSSGAGPYLFKTTAGTGLYFAPTSSSTTQYCSASGYSQ